ncbi:hypothetical protein FB451DRAFT_1194951 [Mycena latifolia]|nr:hypothetical protein FB451DRAFT_1194951 [Mycena latifolia]
MASPLISGARLVPCSKPVSLWIPARCYTVRKLRTEEGDDSSRRDVTEIRRSSYLLVIHVPPHRISTLNPSLLAADDYLNLSLRTRIIIRFPKSRGNSKGIFVYESSRRGATPFPTQCTGFMYYCRDGNAAPLEGSIRFCVTSKNVPSFFHIVHDLLLPSGCPWQNQNPYLGPWDTRGNGYSDPRLVEEPLVTEQLLSQCRSIFGNRATIATITPELILFRLTQQFPANFSRTTRLTVVGEALYFLDFKDLFRAYGDHKYYFHGPIVDPVPRNIEDYKGRTVKPKEEQLLNVSFRRGAPEPWAYDIDRKKTLPTAALRVLWENSRMP